MDKNENKMYVRDRICVGVRVKIYVSEKRKYVRVLTAFVFF